VYEETEGKETETKRNWRIGVVWFEGGYYLYIEEELGRCGCVI